MVLDRTSIALAFDIYGTLIDTQGISTDLKTLIGDQAEAFANTWREKQLEYSFRRGLMDQYVPFPFCIQDSLNYSCLFYGIDLTSKEKQHLLECYRSLPAFDDVITGLEVVNMKGYRLFAFSNGTKNAVNSLLSTAHIRDYFEDVVSVDDVKTFKPNPVVYKHLLSKTHTEENQTWLISSNPFDVLGALSVGIRAAWVKRSSGVHFDPWGIKPTITIENLNELDEKISAAVSKFANE